jgi:hypothetical protein
MNAAADPAAGRIMQSKGEDFVSTPITAVLGSLSDFFERQLEQEINSRAYLFCLGPN